MAEGQHDAVGDGVHDHAADHVDADVRGLRALDRQRCVSANTFAMLGARARLGRTLDAADEAAGSNVVVISTGAWQRYFQGDPGILGRTITLKTLGPEAGFLDGTPLTIVGVMPASFDFPIPNADYWAPITEGSPARKRLGGGVIARLQDGTSIAGGDRRGQCASAKACVRSPRRDLLSRPLPAGVRRFAVEGVKEQIVAASRPALRVITIAVGAVLLIVCANVASLLLARGTARQREIAVRLAVGASRGRILRQFITESLVLAAIGGVLGALLAVGGVYLLREFASPHAQGVFQLSFGGSMLPRLHEIGVDGRLLGLAMALAAITALLVGVMPAFRMSRVDHAQVMNDRGAGGQGGAARDTRVRSMLVVAQMVVATMLLVGAGLLINCFTRLARVDPGWNRVGRADVLSRHAAGLFDRAQGGADRHPAHRTSPPCPRCEAPATPMPALSSGSSTRVGAFVPPGRTPEEMRDNPDNPQLRAVSHDYLQTMGVRLVSGRWFEAERRCGCAAGDHRQPHRGAAVVQQRESGGTPRALRRTHGVSAAADHRRRRRHAAVAAGCESRRRRCSPTTGRCWR